MKYWIMSEGTKEARGPFKSIADAEENFRSLNEPGKFGEDREWATPVLIVEEKKETSTDSSSWCKDQFGGCKMSDTPETDNAERMAWSQEYMVDTDFSRKLECERNELFGVIKSLRENAREDADRIDKLEQELDEARKFSDKQTAKYVESKSNTRLLVKQLVLQIERPAYTVDEAVDKMLLMESAKNFINEVQ